MSCIIQKKTNVAEIVFSPNLLYVGEISYFSEESINFFVYSFQSVIPHACQQI